MAAVDSEVLTCWAAVDRGALLNRVAVARESLTVPGCSCIAVRRLSGCGASLHICGESVQPFARA